MCKLIIPILLMAVLFSCKKESGQVVTISTSYGDMKIRLYDETPLHRDNFIKLAREKFYDGILFHRVIKNFMIQAGDPTSKGADAGKMLGEGSAEHTIQSEFLPQYFHRKGVIAAAREGDQVNPERKSSGSHFYIAQGKVYTPEGLVTAVQNINEKRKLALYNQLKQQYENELMRLQEANDAEGLSALSEKLTATCDSLFVKEELILSDAQKEAYTTVGGIPHLDGQYTVFGEIIEGLNVLDKIAAVKTDERDRPLEDVVIENIIVE